MMFLDRQQLESNATAYADSRGIEVDFLAPLGEGQDGAVWLTSRGSALKLFYRPDNYHHERDCYIILRNAGVDQVGCLNLPKLVDFDDRYLAVEMGIIQPPRLLDFGKVSIGRPPPYWDDARIMAKFHGDGRRDFKDHWTDVLLALDDLQKLGIYYIDPKPGNIVFGDEPDDADWDKEPGVDYSEYEEEGDGA